MTRPQETTTGGQASRFHSTLWETIREAQAGAPDALGRLLDDYWKPVYFFIRRKGRSVEDAKDLTQGFFGSFLEAGSLQSVSPDRGKFRSYVMASVEHYVAYQGRREGAQKRGGHLDFTRAEEDLTCAGPTPERAFFRGWAITILERAMEQLAREVPAEDLDLLAGAVPAGMSASERKNRRYRMRLRVRQILRERLSAASDEEAGSEVRAILSSLE